MKSTIADINAEQEARYDLIIKLANETGYWHAVQDMVKLGLVGLAEIELLTPMADKRYKSDADPDDPG